MMMMKSVFWWRKPEYPEETTDLRLMIMIMAYDFLEVNVTRLINSTDFVKNTDNSYLLIWMN